MVRLISAPMATLSHEAFRRCIARFGGCDEYFTEMIHAPSLLNGGPYERFYLQAGPEPEKIVWQLTGQTAGPLAEAASLVAGLGGIGVDLNMGCCAPQIYRTGAGIAWMTKPLGQAREAVRGVRAALDAHERRTGRHLRLSVKCRLGADGFTDEGFFAFTDMLVDEGVEALTLHARTQKEKPRRLPRWEYVERLALRYSGADGAPRVPVYLNGCVADADSARAALSKAPQAAGLMVARAAAQKPWIFAWLRGALSALPGSAPAPLTVDLLQTALGFIADVERYQPPEFHRTRLQRFFAYYCGNVSFAHYLRTQLQNDATPDGCRALLADYFVRQPEERQLSLLTGVGD